MKPELKNIALSDLHIELADACRVATSYIQGIDELASSMVQQGQMEPIAVRPCTEVERAVTGRQYRIIPFGGIRRVVAWRKAHTPEANAHIKALVYYDNPPEQPLPVGSSK